MRLYDAVRPWKASLERVVDTLGWGEDETRALLRLPESAAVETPAPGAAVDAGPGTLVVVRSDAHATGIADLSRLSPGAVVAVLCDWEGALTYAPLVDVLVSHGCQVMQYSSLSRDASGIVVAVRTDRLLAPVDVLGPGAAGTEPVSSTGSLRMAAEHVFADVLSRHLRDRLDTAAQQAEAAGARADAEASARRRAEDLLARHRDDAVMGRRLALAAEQPGRRTLGILRWMLVRSVRSRRSRS